MNSKIRFRTLRILFFSQMNKKMQCLNAHISKTKIRKIDLTCASEHCSTFWTKNLIWPFLRAVGGRVDLGVTR